jgi:hypothetical protein
MLREKWVAFLSLHVNVFFFFFLYVFFVIELSSVGISCSVTVLSSFYFCQIHSQYLPARSLQA